MINSKQSWRQHLPSRSYKITRNYYVKKNTDKKVLIKKIILVIFIVLLGQSVFQWPFLRLEKFSLSNNQDIQLADLQELIDQHMDRGRYLFFKNNNYFLFDEDKFASDLTTTLNLDAVTLNKKFPDRLEIVVGEKISQFILKKDDTLYLLSAKGGLNRQINALDEKYLILQDFRSAQLNNENILADFELQSINGLYDAWKASFAQGPYLKQIYLTDSFDTLIEAKTDVGYRIKIDPSKDINEQLDNLKKVLAGNIIGADLDYIDLRFGERVFFK